MKLTLEQYHSMIKTRSIGLIGVGVSHRELIRQYAAAGARLTVRDRRSLSELGDFGRGAAADGGSPHARGGLSLRYLGGDPLPYPRHEVLHP